MFSNQRFLDQLFTDKNRQTGKGQIERALAELIASSETLAVMVGRNGGILAQATLLHAETDIATLILDELMPEAENSRLLRGEDLLLWSTSTLPLGFQSTVVERLLWQRYGAVRIQWPDALYQLQRRAALRAAPAEASGLPLSLQRHGARSCEGRCVDLGAGGVRARIHAPSDYPMTAGEVLASVQFSFQGKAYRVGALVRYVEPAGHSRGTDSQYIGLSFVQAPGALQEQIIQYALRCDRERLRSTHR
ncbi:flagellar brake protein [Acidithiobacillus sp.]|uniref:flagellar brake protein n=1 Tax=Acidithiobacillus sp. TaxID=1872118 RepID=UPI0025C34260|nr:flagellar brake protein [Acidithiobacillus sp.]MCK9187577.1 flagellar brake protein [Acidithiobacillus sp.]MCK9358467.1 flagellar brake protein [Acidithiobacillus sp.]